MYGENSSDNSFHDVFNNCDSVYASRTLIYSQRRSADTRVRTANRNFQTPSTRLAPSLRCQCFFKACHARHLLLLSERRQQYPFQSDRISIDRCFLQCYTFQEMRDYHGVYHDNPFHFLRYDKHGHRLPSAICYHARFGCFL